MKRAIFAVALFGLTLPAFPRAGLMYANLPSSLADLEQGMALTAYHYFCADALTVAEERFSASIDDDGFRSKLFS